MVIDSLKLTHWMNIRKLTPSAVAERSGVTLDELKRLLDDGGSSVDAPDGERLATTLAVDVDQLAAAERARPSVIVSTAAEIDATRRGIERDGIHFYDYYNLPCPHGDVGPVLLDIHCPADRAPALNNGHLEPAITLNVGPGDIHGRWSEELSGPGWELLRANRSGDDPWILGDSYVEPSYCPHSYSRAGAEPARIVSYTAASNLAPLVERANGWPVDAFETFLRLVDSTPLRTALERRGWEPGALVELAGVDPDDAGPEDLQRIAALVGLDYRTLLPPVRRHDELGKTCCSVDDSRRTIRPFKSYTVASLASAAHVPDLVGMFVKVERDEETEAELDLAGDGDSHVLVSSGSLVLLWSEDGSLRRRRLEAGDCAWVGAFVPHAFLGRGSAVRLGSAGRGVNTLEQGELTRTFDAAGTLRRAWRDRLGWGYDDSGRG